ncbi:MAG: endonuclease V [Promethearchaeota archaeon]
MREYDLNLELIKTVNNIREAKNIQKKYSKIIETSNLATKDLPTWDLINYIVAIDISYFNRENVEYGVACAVLWDFKLNKIAQHAIQYDIVNFSYIPGFLGFREIPLMVKALQKIKIKPDIIICDAHGIIHPRKFGEATHIGYALNTPSIGIAKNPFVGKCNWKSLKRLKGEKVPIIDNQNFLGYAICLADNQKPVFISIGYRIEIELAIKIALHLIKDHKQPEPLYLADKISRENKKKFKNLYMK